MSNTIKYVEELKHYVDSTGKLCYNDCVFMLEDIKNDLIGICELPVDSNYFNWKLQEIIYKVINIQIRMPIDKENDVQLYD